MDFDSAGGLWWLARKLLSPNARALKGDDGGIDRRCHHHHHHHPAQACKWRMLKLLNLTATCTGTRISMNEPTAPSVQNSPPVEEQILVRKFSSGRGNGYPNAERILVNPRLRKS